ncbi:uncharacterized protein METZ01_LOCUS395110, partial [marine metagenome]
ESSDYHSHNTHRLNKEELEELLLNLIDIKDDLKEFRGNEKT